MDGMKSAVVALRRLISNRNNPEIGIAVTSSKQTPPLNPNRNTSGLSKIRIFRQRDFVPRRLFPLVRNNPLAGRLSDFHPGPSFSFFLRYQFPFLAARHAILPFPKTSTVRFRLDQDFPVSSTSLPRLARSPSRSGCLRFARAVISFLHNFGGTIPS